MCRGPATSCAILQLLLFPVKWREDDEAAGRSQEAFLVTDDMTNRSREASTQLSPGSSVRADGARQQQQRQGAAGGVQRAEGLPRSREASTSGKSDADAACRASDRSLLATYSKFPRDRTVDSSPTVYHDVRRRNTRDFFNSRQKAWISGGGTESERVLDAAALQDKLLRSMKLGLGGQPQALLFVGGGSGVGMDIRRRKRCLPGRPLHLSAHGEQRRASVTSAVSEKKRPDTSASAAGIRPFEPRGIASAACKRWTCEGCSAVNYPLESIDCNHSNSDPDSGCYSICMQPRPSPQCSGDGCGNGITERGGGRERRGVTLAQIRGLEEMPKQLLTTAEWSAVEVRALARSDDASPCPICREAFRGESQVILSCSHVFHRACLASFERFLRARERSCPLCRKVDYQKRITRQGAVAWRQRCARRLQSAFRGYKARREYRLLLRKHYSGGGGNPWRRREFLSRQAADKAGRLAAALENRGDSIDRLFDEFDRGLALSRQVFRSLSPRPVTFTNPSRKPEANRQTKKSEAEETWEQAWKMAGKRGEDECPICMCVMEKIPSMPFFFSPGQTGSREDAAGTCTRSDSGGTKSDGGEDTDYTRRGATGAASGVQRNSSENGGALRVDSGSQAARPRRRDGSGYRAGGERRRATLLLSCSHVFHRVCLRAFEDFNIYEVPLCPVCRHAYESMDSANYPAHIRTGHTK